MNIRRGFLRILIVSAAASFTYGFYFGFSHTTWLYATIDYEELMQKIEQELNQEKCNSGELGYFSPTDQPEKITYVVCGERKVGKSGFCPILKECDGLAKYAEILGKKKIQSGIKVNELQIESIRTDIFSIKSQRAYESLSDRIKNGFDSLIKFFIFTGIGAVVFMIARWVTRGFKNT